SLRGRLAERMAELEGFPNCGGGDIPASAMARMLKELGDLNDRCKFPPHNNGPADSPRLGFGKLPGGWNTPPLTKEIVPLQDVLDSGFVGGGNPELVPGSFLF